MLTDSDKPSVSVAMLAYNHGPYIRRAIEGVLSQQTTFPVQLLIGEDHSTDDTLEIARGYERSYPDKVRIITSERNVGAKRNSQRLEAACAGKYTAYCEGDDYWHDLRKLDKQVRFLESHPDYSLVHTEFRSARQLTGRVIPNAARQPRKLNDADAYNEILSGRRLVRTLTACTRTSTLKAVLSECPECYDPRFLMGDTQRWLEIARRGKVKCLHDVTATYVLLPESASQSQDPRKVLRFILSSKELVDHYLDKYPCPPAVRSATVSRLAEGVLRCACAAGDTAAARKAFIEYRKAGGPWKFQPYLHYVGSKSPRHRAFVHPALYAAGVVTRATRKMRYLLWD